MATIRKNGKQVEVSETEIRPETQAEREHEARVAMSPVSRMQFSIALFVTGVITEQEARDFAAGNALPALALAAIEGSAMSETEKAVAKIRALGAGRVRRLNPLVVMLQRAVPLTDAEADALFASAASIS